MVENTDYKCGRCQEWLGIQALAQILGLLLTRVSTGDRVVPQEVNPPTDMPASHTRVAV